MDSLELWAEERLQELEGQKHKYMLECMTTPMDQLTFTAHRYLWTLFGRYFAESLPPNTRIASARTLMKNFLGNAADIEFMGGWYEFKGAVEEGFMSGVEEACERADEEGEKDQ